MQGSLPIISDYLRHLCRSISELNRIFLTHLDIDHIGSATELQEETRADVIMHEIDAELVDRRNEDYEQLARSFPSFSTDEFSKLFRKIKSIRGVDFKVNKRVNDRDSAPRKQVPDSSEE